MIAQTSVRGPKLEYRAKIHSASAAEPPSSTRTNVWTLNEPPCSHIDRRGRS
jgi:hypothetical protein